MIKFFRALRKRLVDTGQLRQYLMYAAGEILLVMVGILLAVQVNTWNENRKIKQTASAAIKHLINEFERNHRDLLRVYAAKKRCEQGMRHYLQALNDEHLSKAEKATLGRPDVGGYTWNPTNPILNSLLSSGKLDNLASDSLKYLLASWNDSVEDYLEQQAIYNEIDIPNLFTYESDKVPLPVMHGDYTSAKTEEKYIASLDLPEARAKIVDQLMYHNLLAACVNRLYIQVMSAQDVIEISNRIQKTLAKEIE